MPSSSRHSPCNSAPRASSRRRDGVRERERPRAPRRAFARDGDAVSEVVGSILMFGIVSMLFTTSLLGFVAAKEAAQTRVIQLQAESVAQRVAGVVVAAALFHEEHPGAGPDMNFTRFLQLQDQIEGRDYSVDLANDTVTVNVTGLSISVKAPLLSANQTAGLTVCDQDPFHPGTILRVRVSTDRPSDCYWIGPPKTIASDTMYAYLERRS